MDKKRKLKPQVKIVLIVLAVFLGFILLENILGGISSLIKNAKSKIEYNEKYEVNQDDPIYQKEQQMQTFVNEIMVKLSEGKYEEVYQKVDPDYIEALNLDTVEKFKNNIDKYLGKIPQDTKLMEYNKNGDKYICQFSVTRDEEIELIQIILKPRVNNDFYIIIDKIENIEKYNNQFKFTNSQFEYDVKYRYVRGNEEVLVMAAQNKTSNNLVGSLLETTLVKSSHDECELKNTEELEKVEFPAGETVVFSLVFHNEKFKAYPNDSIKLKVNFDNGTNIDRTINMISADDY